MEFIPAKTIVTTNKNPNFWFGNDFNMNIYKGCCHGCIYCDSRSDCYRVDNFDIVRAKENALSIIDRELKNKRKKGIIGTGAMSDPYNHFEKEYQLTRWSLELINLYGFGVNLTTKSDLVTRDIDILQKINDHSPVSINITITSFDDSIARLIEEHAPNSSRRFEAIRQLTKGGILTGVTMMPILPYITDTEENIVKIIRKTAEAGGKYIYPSFGLSMRSGQREYLYEKLEQSFPGLAKEYHRLYGDKYSCSSPKSRKLWNIFKRECDKCKIVYRMNDIISLIKGTVKHEQISLFLK